MHFVAVHPHLQFISHLPLATMGEQFAAQTLRCIPDQTWLFKFGRVPVNFILSEWVWSVRTRVIFLFFVINIKIFFL